MNRDEAILRELNLYPLWVRREAAPVAPLAAPQPVEPVSVSEQCVEAAAVAEVRIDTLDTLGWAELKARVQGCTACALRAGCKQTVFGVGDEKADWLFVGEGPGADEDERRLSGRQASCSTICCWPSNCSAANRCISATW